jgi:uncharacterized transporter YbjL
MPPADPLHVLALFLGVLCTGLLTALAALSVLEGKGRRMALFAAGAVAAVLLARWGGAHVG